MSAGSRALPRSAALLAALAGLVSCGAQDGVRDADHAAARPTIVLVSLDTLRADALGAYGYARPTSPALDRFAAESVRFDEAWAHSTATLPSHLSLFTSLYPPQFGITRRDGRNHTQARTRLRLADPLTTLAEVLRERGYRTLAFTDGGFVAPRYGVDRGFDHFDTSPTTRRRYVDNFGRSVRRIGRALGREERQRGARPLFLFVHTYDIHEPYSPPPPFATRFTDIDFARFGRERGFAPRPQVLTGMRDSLSREDAERVRGFYDNGILAADHAFASLVALLRRRGLYEDALIAVLSDHGEEFLDHGDFGHGPSVYQELVRVPLLLRLPGGRHGGRVVAEPVGLIDVAPTLLDFAGIESHPQFEGRSLRGVVEGNEDGAWLRERPLYADDPNLGVGVRSLRRGPWKLVHKPREGVAELYRLEDDPRETRDLSREQPQRAARLLAELERWAKEMEDGARRRGTLAVPSGAEPSKDEAAALRELGYVE